MSRLLFLSTLLLLSLSAVLVSSQSCTEVNVDPFPGVGSSASHPALDMQETSRWLLTTLGRDHLGVRIYDLTTLTTNGVRTVAAVASRTPTGSTCTLATNGASYTPMFGKSVQVSDSLVVIGAPNRAQTTPAYSTIDVVNPTSLVAGSAYATVATTIYDTTTNNLGLVMAADTQKTFLASYYTPTTIVVYNPVVSRSSMTYDSTAASLDALVTLPTGFRMSSMAIQNAVLLVTGVVTDATSGNCVPQLISYIFTSSTRVWSQSGTANLLQNSGAGFSSDSNSIPCFTDPSAALPVDFSYDNSKIVVGVPDQSCVYAIDAAFSAATLKHTFTQSVRCASTTTLAASFGTNFGRSVSFSSKTDGARFVVASDDTVNQYFWTDWTSTTINPLDATSAPNFYQYPNRFQLSPSGVAGLTRDIGSIVAKSNGLVVLYQPYGATPLASDLVTLLPGTAVAAGSQWNSISGAIEPCVAGRYSTGTSNSYQGCSLCAPGTYQSASGQSSCTTCGTSDYCPSGSVTNSYSSTSFTTSNAFYSSLPWLEYDGGYAESFEELLIGTIFSVSLYPTMILFFILIGLTIVIYVSSFWADSDGDEKDCCTSYGNCCLKTYRLYGRFSFWVSGRTAPFPYVPRERDVRPDVIHYDSNGEAIEKFDASGVKRGGNSVQVRNADGSVTTTTYAPDALPGSSDEESSPECSGFMWLIFILFALSSVSFTGIYLASYDPNSSKGTEHQNIIRTKHDYTRSHSAGMEVEYSQSVNAVLSNAFELKLSFVGLSSTVACSKSLISTFSFDGCTYPNDVTVGGAPLSCTNRWSSSSATSFSASGGSNGTATGCDVTVSFPQGTSFVQQQPSTSSFKFVLSSSTPSFQAIKLGFHQNSSNIVPFVLPASDITGSSSNEQNTAIISDYEFSETLYSPASTTATSTAQLVASPISRSWLLTPIGFRSQNTSSFSNIFYTNWYSEISDLDSPVLTTADINSAIYTGASTSSSSGTTIQVTLNVNPSYTIIQSQRLIGNKAVLWFIVLGVVVIFNLILLAEGLWRIGYGMCCRRVQKAIVGVAQLTAGATGPMVQQSNNQTRNDGLNRSARISAPAYPDVIRHPPPPPPQPMMYGGYNQPQSPMPYPPMMMQPYPPYPTMMTPSRPSPYPFGYPPLPRTPGGRNFLPPLSPSANPSTTFEEDRQRYQAAAAARSQALGLPTPNRPSPKAQVTTTMDDDSDRIQIELSTRQQAQRGGFEL